MLSEPSGGANDVAIRASELNKHFRIYRWPFDRLREALLLDRRHYHTVVHALRDVSFSVRQGESVGLLGRNGSGKTSLLSVLAGTLAPTTGSVDVYGRVGAILALGIGFLPQYTGRENARNGLIALGVPSAELDEKMAQVVEFSELGKAIDHPIKTYSSGMHSRLGFSLAVCIEPDILLVDEALSVGDAAFQHKCQKRIRTFLEQGKTLLFVSHDMGLLESTCDRGIVLDKGHVVYDGMIKGAVRQYRLQYFGEEATASQPRDARDWGDPNVGLAGVEVLDAKPVGERLFEVRQGDRVHLKVRVRVREPIERPSFQVIARTALGKEICGYSTARSSTPVPQIQAGEFTLEVRVPFGVPAGSYSFEIGLFDMAGEKPRLIHIWEEVCAVRVVYAGYAVRGMIDPGIEILYDSRTYSLQAEVQRARDVSPESG